MQSVSDSRPVRRVLRAVTAACVLTAALATTSDAAVLTWTADLSGSQEIPSVASAGTGSGTVVFDDATNILSLDLAWQDLSGQGVQAHIHCCVVSPPGNVVVALDLWLSGSPRPDTGSYSATFDLDLVNPFRPAFTTANGGTTLGAMQAFMAAMNAGDRAYYNIHTQQSAGGEIRGNLSVPEPVSLSLVLAGAGALIVRRRSSRR